MTIAATVPTAAPSTGAKVLAGVVSGLSAAMVTSSLLYLLWFIALGRPGSHIPTVEQIATSIRTPEDKRTDDQLRQDAERARSGMEGRAKFLWTPLEIIILTSTCLVAAYFAAIYGKAQDMGDGKAGGTLLLPTMIGTAVGAVVLWLFFSILVARPAAAHPTAHAAPHSETTHTPAAADHGSQKPVSPPKSDAEHDEHHEAKDWNAILVEYHNFAELAAYLLGTIVAAAAGVLAPRGAPQTTTASTASHSYAPAH